MGIKFHCPNGHLLNVKAFLAGKRAICPKCGVKVVVPLEAPPTTEARLHLDDDELSVLAAAHTQRTAADRRAAAHDGALAIDPIDEAPQAVWYVTPPSGSQFGPASGETLRAWLAEGRITRDTLVWRAGWPEWQPASAAFPILRLAATDSIAVGPNPRPPFSGVGAAAPVGEPDSPDYPPAPTLEEADENAFSLRRRRRPVEDVAKYATPILIALTIIFVIILILFLRNDLAPQQSSAVFDLSHLYL